MIRIVKMSATPPRNNMRLAGSSAARRRVWAATIIEHDVRIHKIEDLLHAEHKTALRFLWLLSEIAIIDPDKLYRDLAYLFELRENINPVYHSAFATFWLLAGVPPRDEVRAIGLLFSWVVSPETNATIRSRSLAVLFKLSTRYPDLKYELRCCIEDQLDKHSAAFKIRATKVLSALGR